MNIALWIIAICEIIRAIQNERQLWALRHEPIAETIMKLMKEE